MEALWFKVLCQNSKNMNIGIIYRPPQGNVEVFIDKLINCVNEINKDNKSEIYVLGDFNINYLTRMHKIPKNLNTLNS